MFGFRKNYSSNPMEKNGEIMRNLYLIGGSLLAAGAAMIAAAHGNSIGYERGYEMGQKRIEDSKTNKTNININE